VRHVDLEDPLGLGAYPTGGFGAPSLRQRMSPMGRKGQFAAGGSSRWPGIAAGRAAHKLQITIERQLQR